MAVGFFFFACNCLSFLQSSPLTSSVNALHFITHDRARVTAAKFEESTPVKKVRFSRAQFLSALSLSALSFSLSIFFSYFFRRRSTSTPPPPLLTLLLFFLPPPPPPPPPPSSTKQTIDPDLGQEGPGQDPLFDGPSLHANAREKVEEEKTFFPFAFSSPPPPPPFETSRDPNPPFLPTFFFAFLFFLLPPHKKSTFRSKFTSGSFLPWLGGKKIGLEEQEEAENEEKGENTKKKKLLTSGEEAFGAETLF